MPPPDPTSAPGPDPLALLRSRAYVKLLVLAALIGIPVSAVAYGFLELVAELQDAAVRRPAGRARVRFRAGLVAAAAARARRGCSSRWRSATCPGTGGHSPADGFHAGGPLPPIELPGVFLAALATLAFGAVLGPEAPLIAIGSGLGVLAVRLAARDAPGAGDAS